jgi:hypothetical protein
MVIEHYSGMRKTILLVAWAGGRELKKMPEI